jgi:hypothetical protein
MSDRAFGRERQRLATILRRRADRQSSEASRHRSLRCHDIRRATAPAAPSAYGDRWRLSRSRPASSAGQGGACGGRRDGVWMKLRSRCDVLKSWHENDALGDFVGGQALPERLTDSLVKFSGSVRGSDYVCRYRLSPDTIVLAAHQRRPDIGQGGDGILDFLGVDMVRGGVALPPRLSAP